MCRMTFAKLLVLYASCFYVDIIVRSAEASVLPSKQLERLPNDRVVPMSGNKDLEIYSLHIKSDIKLRYATTLITSRVVNRSPNVAYEANFDVTLPNQAMISNFTMEIDGTIYPGQVKEKAEAQKQYDKAKKKGQSAGQVKARPRETNKFSVNVNVAAQGKVSFNLTYQELLERKKGMYQHVIYINPGQPVHDLKVDIALSESRDITKLIVPPIADERLTNALSTEEQNTEAQVIRPTSKSAYIQYHPEFEKQKEMDADRGISGLFRVFYDVDRGNSGGEVLAVNGYFVHFFAPEGLEPVSKNVLFIMDVSGSMDGLKLRQLKQAMMIILKDMHEGDHFALMRFSSSAKMWSEGFVPVNKANIAKAMKYVQNTRAQGWTNIDAAILTGIRQIKIQGGDRSGIIVFLTDGEPTKGEKNPKKILKNVREVNEGAQLFSLAFGTGADYDFVKKVAAQNYGVGRRIYEDSDADLQIAGFYDDISSALLQDVQFKYVGDEVDNETITLSKIKSYFNGSELILAGKLKDPSVKTLSSQIIANSVEGDFQLSADTPITDIEIDENVGGLTKLEDLVKITEKIWAYLTIKQLLDRELLDITDEERKEIRAKILEQSLTYNFVTPLTSMVVTKPEESDISDLEGADALEDVADSAPSPIGRRPPASAGSWGGGGDPHFQMWFKDMANPFCFDVLGQPGEIYRIVDDEETGLKVNARIVKGKEVSRHGIPRTFIGEIFIEWKREKIHVLPSTIVVNGKSRNWDHKLPYNHREMAFTVSKDNSMLNIHFVDNVRLEIKRIMQDAYHTSHLNFVIADHERLSKKAGGLVGQFIHKTAEIENVTLTENHVRGIMKVNSHYTTHRMRVELVSRKKVMLHSHRLCWIAGEPGETLLDASPETYLLKDLYS